MDKYTASNGSKIAIDDDGDIRITTEDGLGDAYVWHNNIDALREFFRAEEDERLGRWRSVNNPQYTVSRKTKDELVITHEDGRWWYYHSGPGGHPTSQELAAVAHEYFDAHPEPKPRHWTEAKIISWRDERGFLPWIAQRAETIGISDRPWLTGAPHSEMRWLTEQELVEIIGDAKVTVLVPEEPS